MTWPELTTSHSPPKIEGQNITLDNSIVKHKKDQPQQAQPKQNNSKTRDKEKKTSTKQSGKFVKNNLG